MYEVKQTTNYELFKKLQGNRNVYTGHVTQVKRAFAEHGNLTKVKPIIVNEDMEVIDGQHTLQAAIDLHEPVNYVVIPGLRITDAISMNILQRGWSIDDYAHSYAELGNPHYQRYIKLKEEYDPIGHSVLIKFIYNQSNHSGLLKRFRQGDFAFVNDDKLIRRNIEIYKDIVRVTHVGTGGMAEACLHLANTEIYDHERMIRKLLSYGTNIRQYDTKLDNLRQLEEIYNTGITEANRVRLF